jgi:ATP-dependent Clp protease ATP-binding subunit ClpA
MKEFLIAKGYDPDYGARPLKRVIQQHILDPLALKIVAGEIPEESTVTIDYKKEKVEIKTKHV